MDKFENLDILLVEDSPADAEQFTDTVAKAGRYWMLMNKAPQ